MKEVTRKSLTGLVLMACLGLPSASIVPAAQADGAETAELTRMERVAKDFDMIQKLLRNAQTKLRNDVVGMNTGAGSDGSRPVLRCCSPNIERIDKHMKSARVQLSEAGECYERTRDIEAADALEQVQIDLKSIDSGLRAFELTRTKREAEEAYAGLTRAWVQLLEDAQWLTDCELPEPGADE